MECDSTCREDPFHHKGYGKDGVSMVVNLKTIAIDVKIPEISYPYYEERVNGESNTDQIDNSLTVMDELYFPISRLSQSQRAIKPSNHKCQKVNTTDRRPSLTRTAHLVAVFHREHLRKQHRMRRGQPTTPRSNENHFELGDESENLNENRSVYRTYAQNRVLTEQNGATPELKVDTYRQADDLSLQLYRMSLFNNKENNISSAEYIFEIEN
nr:expressed protein [Hymenolepis microstoma]